VPAAEHEWRASHTLNASSYKDISSPSLYRLSRAIDSLQARTTEPIHGLTGNRLGETGKEEGHTSDVAIVLASLVRAPHDYVVD
jgi:hypothetical protein